MGQVVNAVAHLLVFVVLLLASSLTAQQFRTNYVSQAQAVEIATHLRWGMSEKKAVDVLEARGLHYQMGVGVPPVHWTIPYLLSDGCFLELEIEGGQVLRWWRPGEAILTSARIVSNTTTVVSISLTNRPQPAGAANQGQPSGSETNRTPGAAGPGGLR